MMYMHVYCVPVCLYAQDCGLVRVNHCKIHPNCNQGSEDHPGLAMRLVMIYSFCCLLALSFIHKQIVQNRIRCTFGVKNMSSGGNIFVFSEMQLYQQRPQTVEEKQNSESCSICRAIQISVLSSSWPIHLLEKFPGERVFWCKVVWCKKKLLQGGKTVLAQESPAEKPFDANCFQVHKKSRVKVFVYVCDSDLKAFWCKKVSGIML